MAKTFKIKILTLGKIVFDSEAEKLFTSSANGKIEVLANHAASIFSTIPCETYIVDEEGDKKILFTSKGVINIKDNVVTFCCDSAEFASDIDKDRAIKAKEKAERRIASSDKYDVDRAKEALLRANLRIKIASEI